MTDHTLTQISHYQKKLEKYAATGENEKLLCCIHKLKYLPVTVNHLEVTGVGKSINGLRHKNGVIGEKARALVHKWKLMVAEEEEQQEQEHEMYSLQKEENIPVPTKTSFSQSNTPRAEKEEEYDPSDEGDRLQIQEEQAEEDVEMNVTYNPGGHSVENEEENCNGYNPKTSREDYLSIGSSEQYDYNPCNKPESEPRRSTSVEKYLPNGDAHEDKMTKERSHKSRDESKHKKKHKSRHDHHEKSKSKSSEHDNSSDHKKSKHKSSKSKSKKKDKEEESSSKQASHSSSRSHSSQKSKNLGIETSSPPNSSNHGNNSSSPSTSNLATSTSISSLPSSSDSKRHKESEDEHESHTSKKKSSDKQKEKKSHKSPKSSKDEHKSSKRKREEEAPSEFEAALMGMDSTSSKKKKKKKSKDKDKENKEVPSLDTPPDSPHTSSPSKQLKELDLDYREQLPDLPTNFDIEVSAPQLMTHYKPLPHLPQRNANKDPFTSSMTNEEALNYMFTSKSSKQRRIYAGKATALSTVPSLFNICIRILQENIDALETTGGIPYDILKPILEKATPQQLFSLEDYNPYLLEDTDILWSSHCRKSFKNKQREDMETWREMFIRCTDEHQERMRSITESLQKKYITKAPPKRTTQLAYINTAAKPPKSVARAQARYGTASTSAAPVRIASKTTDQHNSASGSSNGASSSSSSSSSNAVPKPERPFPNKPPAVKKPKVAPLMGKARQLMKKVCRR